MTFCLFQVILTNVAQDDPTSRKMNRPLSGLPGNGSLPEGEGDKKLCGKQKRVEREEEEIPLKKKVAADGDGVIDRIPPGAKPDGPTQNQEVNVKDVQKVLECIHSRRRTLKARRNEDPAGNVESEETTGRTLQGADGDLTEPGIRSTKSPLTSDAVDRNHNHISSPIKPRESKLTKEKSNVSAAEDVLPAGGPQGPPIRCVHRRQGQTDGDQEPEPLHSFGGEVAREFLPMSSETGSLLSYFKYFQTEFCLREI